jgi:hypothetical protein
MLKPGLDAGTIQLQRSHGIAIEIEVGGISEGQRACVDHGEIV